MKRCTQYERCVWIKHVTLIFFRIFMSSPHTGWCSMWFAEPHGCRLWGIKWIHKLYYLNYTFKLFEILSMNVAETIYCIVRRLSMLHNQRYMCLNFWYHWVWYHMIISHRVSRANAIQWFWTVKWLAGYTKITSSQWSRKSEWWRFLGEIG